MNEYNMINRCLGTLKDSRIDVLTKLRMESLLIGLKMLLLMDDEQERMADLEELLAQIKEVCKCGSPDGVKAVVDHVRELQSSMTDCLKASC